MAVDIPRQKDLIQPIFLDEKEKITSFSQLLGHVRKRQIFFLSTLANLSTMSDVRKGWQSISRDLDDKIHKEDVEKPNLQSIFTGKDWCTTATLALAEAISRLVKENNLLVELEVGNISTGFNAEDWNTGTPKKGDIKHTLLKLKDLKSQTSVYLDTTYAQIHHQTAGKIIQIAESDLEKHFRTPKEKPIFVPDEKYLQDSAMRANALSFFEKPEHFERLVSVML